MVALGLALILLRPSPSITLTIPAARIPVVLDAIAKQTGQRLSADPLIAKEVVAIRVAAAPADQVLQNLAQAVGGEWRESNGTKYLVDSPTAIHADQERRTHRRIEAVKQYLDGRDFDKLPEPEEDAKARANMEAQLKKIQAAKTVEELDKLTPDTNEPVGDFTDWMLKAIPTATYVNLPLRSRVVFSDNPTDLQLPFPASAEPTIAAFKAAERHWNTYALPLLESWTRRISELQSDGETETAIDNDNTGPPPADHKLEFVVEFSDEGDSDQPYVNLHVVDANGQLVNYDTTTSGARTIDDWSVKSVPSVETDSLTADEKNLFDLLFSRAKRIRPGIGADRKRWLPYLTDPVTHDPLALIGQPIVHAAELKGVNIVANIDDMALNEGRWVNGEENPPTFESLLGKWDDVPSSPGWVVGRPRSMESTRNHRLDRRAVQKLLNKILENDGLSLDDQIEYSLSSESDQLLNEWDYRYCEALETGDGRNGARPVFWNIDTKALRVYGALPPETRPLLRTTGVPINEITPALARIVGQQLLADSLKSGKQGSLEFEPTDIYANGRIPDGILRAVDESHNIEVIPVAWLRGELLAQDLPQVAEVMGRGLADPTLEDLDGPSEGWPAGPIAGYRILHTHSFSLVAQLTPGIQLTWQLSETNYDKEPLTKYDRLPPDFLKAVEATKTAATNPDPTTKPPPP